MSYALLWVKKTEVGELIAANPGVLFRVARPDERGSEATVSVHDPIVPLIALASRQKLHDLLREYLCDPADPPAVRAMIHDDDALVKEDYELCVKALLAVAHDEAGHSQAPSLVAAEELPEYRLAMRLTELMARS